MTTQIVYPLGEQVRAEISNRAEKRRPGCLGEEVKGQVAFCTHATHAHRDRQRDPQAPHETHDQHDPGAAPFDEAQRSLNLCVELWPTRQRARAVSTTEMEKQLVADRPCRKCYGNHPREFEIASMCGESAEQQNAFAFNQSAQKDGGITILLQKAR